MDEKFHEILLQLLYSLELGQCREEGMISLLVRELKVPKSKVKRAYDHSQVIWEQKAILDEKIEKTSKEYSFERIGGVEKSVLRFGLYYLLFDQEMSAETVINETHRLAKKFATKQAGAYINAILDPFCEKIPT